MIVRSQLKFRYFAKKRRANKNALYRSTLCVRRGQFRAMVFKLGSSTYLCFYSGRFVVFFLRFAFLLFSSYERNAHHSSVRVTIMPGFSLQHWLNFTFFRSIFTYGIMLRSLLWVRLDCNMNLQYYRHIFLPNNFRINM